MAQAADRPRAPAAIREYRLSGHGGRPSGARSVHSAAYIVLLVALIVVASGPTAPNFAVAQAQPIHSGANLASGALPASPRAVAAGPPSQNGTLKGTLSPTGAYLSLDGQPIYPSGGSYSVTVRPGVHFLQANAINYAPQSRQFNIQPGQVVWENFTLIKLNGWINGTLSPASAALTIDGKSVHVTGSGSFSELLPPGGHAINASFPGDTPFSDYEIVLGGATTWVNISLSAPTSTFFTPVVIAAIVGAAIVAALGVFLVLRQRAATRRTAEEEARVSAEEPRKKVSSRGSKGKRSTPSSREK